MMMYSWIPIFYMSSRAPNISIYTSIYLYCTCILYVYYCTRIRVCIIWIIFMLCVVVVPNLKHLDGLFSFCVTITLSIPIPNITHIHSRTHTRLDKLNKIREHFSHTQTETYTHTQSNNASHKNSVIVPVPRTT